MTTTHFEIDDTPLIEAVFDYEVTYCPAEPDVGIFRPYHEVSGEITGGKIGGLELDRAQMIAAFGIEEIERMEELEAASLIERYDRGEAA